MSSPQAPVTPTPDKVKEDFVERVGSVEVRLPSLTYLKPGTIRRIRRLGLTDALYTIIELSVPGEVLAALDDMDHDSYHRLIASWQRHSGVSLGES
ncbi:hypothetical protein [Nocardia ignorata]|uniref:Tail assembly chaperone E/41/14-like protein n=1 Tax=Nocardia ignorata TaxID=145285 RepID=A0A4R6NY57_NOCIG|nr:hypothetical protein [Nocardia ignorata]TDP27617.1 hypothetical protein DFR75_1238 [Nocardia ignorata]